MTAVDFEKAKRRAHEKMAAPNDAKSKHDAAAGSIGLTEDELAQEFTRRHAQELRYVAIWSAWLRWTGNLWRTEITLEAFDLARAVCRDAAAQLGTDRRRAKLRAIILKSSTRAAVENLARADRRHAATPEQWDRDLFLMNGDGMTTSLQSGAQNAPDPRDYITKAAATAPASPGTPHPLWDDFLDRVTAGKTELKSYLQRVAGYCLTGSVREHVLFFLYGLGANGKSVFINTLVDIMGDYALVIGTEMLMVSNTDRHPTEVARLRGVRLAVGSEIEVGKFWAESKIKSLTGGDRLQGRYMRQDFFEFDPQFKLMIIGNHKPSLRGVDEAIKRRLHLIPFTVTIPPDERDQELREKLKAEWPAILRWAIDGCLEWQQDGLNPPQAVLDATASYLAGEDIFERWRDDWTIPDPEAWESSADLWASWKRWAENAGEPVGTQKTFGQQLEEHGLISRRQPGTGNRGYNGAQLVRANYTDDPRYGG